MPFEVVLTMLILFVAFPAVLFRGVAHLRRSKASSRGEGLKASDLRQIVEDAVATATEPLHDRIDTLEGLLMGETPGAAASRRGRIAEPLLDDEMSDDLDGDPAGAREPRRGRRVAS